MAEAAVTDDRIRRRVNLWVLIVAATLVVAAAAGIYSAFRFVDQERQRSLQEWQIRLGIVADSRTAAVNDWFESQFSVLKELAENASLQLYMTELSMAKGDADKVTDAAAQAGYLRNLLVATAERSGFTAPAGNEPQVAANVERAGLAGIGLLDAAGNPIVSSPGMPPVTPRIRKAVAQAMEGEPALIDLYEGASNQPTIGFVLPIYAIQSDRTEGIGAVVGIRLVGDDLYGRLAQPGETAKTAETYLVRKEGGTVRYL